MINQHSGSQLKSGSVCLTKTRESEEEERCAIVGKIGRGMLIVQDLWNHLEKKVRHIAWCIMGGGIVKGVEWDRSPRWTSSEREFMAFLLNKLGMNHHIILLEWSNNLLRQPNHFITVERARAAFFKSNWICLVGSRREADCPGCSNLALYLARSFPKMVQNSLQLILLSYADETATFNSCSGWMKWAASACAKSVDEGETFCRWKTLMSRVIDHGPDSGDDSLAIRLHSWRYPENSFPQELKRQKEKRKQLRHQQLLVRRKKRNHEKSGIRTHAGCPSRKLIKCAWSKSKRCLSLPP